jgi:NAD(P)-dependent dehydrogenase (short-subunit alcohol dehydrogenase family)
MFSLQNKTAIVTGGGSGIGKAIATLFAAQGATVFILDLDEKNTNAAAAEIKDKGGNAFARPVDVGNQLQVNDVIKEIAAGMHTIDILVNNAGIAHIGNALNTNAADFDRLMQVNVKGVFHCLQATLPFMLSKGGAVVNMASIASSVGITDRFAYSMSKGAVVGMTLSTARDFLQYGIRCNCISPARVHTPFVDGFIKTNFAGEEKEMFEKLSKSQPIGRMAEPEEIAYLVLYLCSDEAAFITGCDYPIDGGFIKLNN